MNQAKSKERTELHRKLWAVSESVRGAVDGWDFRCYTLGLLFFLFVAKDKYAELVARSDAESDLGAALLRAFREIESSAPDGKLDGVFGDFDVTSAKLGATVERRNETLAKLLHGVGSIQTNGVIDALGDAYEFMASNYASNAGKSGGEYFTPLEVSELVTRLGTVGKTSVNRAYDPSCGSGSLLLTAAKVLGRESVGAFCGQEINATSFNLCRMNLVLQGVPFDKMRVYCDDTLLRPLLDDAPFDLIVGNPPYSVKWIGDDSPELVADARFSPAGALAPRSKADLAFAMHCVSALSSDGVCALVMFPGVAYRGGAEMKIRKYLVETNVVDCLIQLPPNLFFGTQISTLVFVFRKGRTDDRTLFIDASSEFVKDGKINRLTSGNIRKIVDVYASRKEEQYVSRLVPASEIAANDWNLSVSSYVAAKDEREEIDIVKLNAEIDAMVARRRRLEDELAKLIRDEFGV